jgi:hypothetical protein
MLEVEFKVDWGKGGSWVLKGWTVHSIQYEKSKVS